LRIITLLTDFGLKDPYVSIMKGVILSIYHDAEIIDVTHDVAPQDVREAAFLILEYYPYFEKETIHVAVVDPTVGGARRPLIVRKDDHFFVGPDNGIFTFLYDGEVEVYSIDNRNFMRERVSSTFHGRDVFAPAAAHLASGFHPSAFGPMVTDPVFLAGIRPEVGEGVMRGEVVRFDRFGNAITNINEGLLQTFLEEKPFSITIGGLTFNGIDRSYYQKELACLIGSNGYLEFGLFKGSFKEKRGIRKGDPVVVALL
jgi:S-adenosyl-L-methionine hydrolase (adenosine-forming)